MYWLFTRILLLLLVLLNCSIYVPSRHSIDKELLPYVQTFLKHCKAYNRDCSDIKKYKIELSTMMDEQFLRLIGIKSDGFTVGRCWHASNEVEINAAYFKTAIEAELEQLMIHELGHCLFDLEHTKEEAIAIMNPYVLPPSYYLLNYNDLMNEFFNCKENCPVVKYNGDNY